MRGPLVGVLILGVGFLMPENCLGFQGSATPSEEFKTLLKEYERGPAVSRILTDAERMVHIGQVYRHHDRVAGKLVALAEKYPGDPLAVDGLVRAIGQVNTTPWPVELVGKDEAWIRAFDLLLKDHLASEKLGPACTRLAWGYRREYEGFLREVLGKSPNREVRAQACLALARYLAGRQQRVNLVKSEPALAKEFADLFGKEYLDRLVAEDATKAGVEVETLLEMALRDHGTVRLPEGDLVSERARAELFELKHLAVGCKAPEVEGEDQDGKRFKLSDYRGKVVLLDFWSEY